MKKIDKNGYVAENLPEMFVQWIDEIENPTIRYIVFIITLPITIALYILDRE